MAWTTPGTATAGDVLTAAFWNEQVRDNLTVLRASILNVVSAKGDNTADITVTAAATTTAIEATITPTSTNSKILMISRVGGQATAGTSNRIIRSYLIRASTELGRFDHGNNDTTSCAFTATGVTLDSPSTTSAITYYHKISRGSSGTGDIQVYNSSDRFPEIILVEIGF